MGKVKVDKNEGDYIEKRCTIIIYFMLEIDSFYMIYYI